VKRGNGLVIGPFDVTILDRKVTVLRDSLGKGAKQRRPSLSFVYASGSRALARRRWPLAMPMSVSPAW